MKSLSFWLVPLLLYGLQARAQTFVAETTATPSQVRRALQAATVEAARSEVFATAQLLVAKIFTLDPENRSAEQIKFISDFTPQFNVETQFRIYQGAFFEAVRAGNEKAAALAYQEGLRSEPGRAQEFICGGLDFFPNWSVAAFTAVYQPNDPTLDQGLSVAIREFFSRLAPVAKRVPGLGQVRCQVGFGDRVVQISVTQAMNRFRKDNQKNVPATVTSTGSQANAIFGCSKEAIVKHLRWSWTSFQPGVFSPLGLSEGTCQFMGHVAVKGDLYTLYVNWYIPDAQKFIVAAKDPEGLVDEIEKHLKEAASARR